jgi:rhodanese-related sulfurtransferase
MSLKKKIFLFFITIANLGYSQKASYETMLKGLLRNTIPVIKISEAKTNKTALFLDTREKKEYKISHIKNAQYVGYEKFNINVLAKIPKDREIIVYCSIGKRSEDIGEKLVKAGFKNVKNLYGGIFYWVNEDLPIVDNSGKQTNKIHVYSKEWGIWVLKGEKHF